MVKQEDFLMQGIEQDEHARALALIGKATSILPSPLAISKLIALLRKGDAHTSEIVEVVRYDQRLTAEVLRISNSASHRPIAPVASIDEAVLQLGSKAISETVIVVFFREVFSGGNRIQCRFAQDLWRHSVITALATKLLVEKCETDFTDQSLSYTAGLLHDIGKMIFQRADHERITFVQQEIQRTGLTSSQAEKLSFGVDHAVVGSALLSGWQLHPDIVTAILHHNHPEKSGTDLAGLLCLASMSAHIADDETKIHLLDSLFSPFLMSQLRISRSEIEETLNEIRNQMSAVESFLQS